MKNSRAALVLEDRLQPGDRADLLRIAAALTGAGVEVRPFEHSPGRGARARLRVAVLADRPELLIATGAASARDLQGVARLLGSPLLCYLFSGDDGAPVLGGVSPTRTVVATQSARQRLRSGSLPEERIHVLPADAPVQDHVDLIIEALDERGASLGKRLAREGVARLGGPAIGRIGRRGRSISLAYHQVRTEMRGWDPYLIVNRSTLEHQVRALQRRGYTGMTMARQAAQLLDGDERPATFAVTFDDGYADTLELAAPVLLALQVPFTVYVITGVVAGQVRSPWYEVAAQAVLCREVRPRTLPLLEAQDRLRPLLQAMPPSPALARAVVGALKDWPPQERQALAEEIGHAGGEALYAATPRYLDAQGVRKLHDAGVEISSHTQTHPILPLLDDAALERELGQSRAYLTALLGGCEGLAYPNGNSDTRVRAAAQAAGYRYAMGVTMPSARERTPDRYNLGRQLVCEWTSAGLDHRFDEAVFMARASGLLG